MQIRTQSTQEPKRFPPEISLLTDPSPTNPQFSYSSTNIKERSFWGERRSVARSTTLRYQLEILRKTGRYDAFRLKWHPVYGEPISSWPVPRHLFWDSDIAKWIEGACYFLNEDYDTEIDTAVKELVKMIQGAQQSDGYLNIHYTVVEPGKRFTNLRDMHELYNAGHLVEAALAHHQHYKNHDFLGPMLKYVDLLYHVFGDKPGHLAGYPGHPEVELALIRLFKVTGDQRHLELARFFLDERGNPQGFDGQHYYSVESKRRGDVNGQMPVHYPYRDPYRYQQAHVPIVKQPTIEGHSVRAMYLLTAVADLCLVEEQFNDKYRATLDRLWDNMVERKMYLTGGVGAIHQWEGFGTDCFLPLGSDEGGCYAETCAAIGVMMLAERLLQLSQDGKYADVLELCLYNAVLTGMSSNGKAFTYTNQLASSSENLSKREEWFDCACCPPNVLRTLGILGGYMWTQQQTGDKSADVNVYLYGSASIEFKVGNRNVSIVQESDWPRGDDINFSISSNDVDITLRLRVPLWASSWKIESSKGYLWQEEPEKGFITIPCQWLCQNRQFKFVIPLRPRIISTHPLANTQTIALARGPLVYCVEDADNPWVDDHFKMVCFDITQPFVEKARTDIVPNETCVGIDVPKGARFLTYPEPYSPMVHSEPKVSQRNENLSFIPFYARANRGGRAMMRVALRTL